MTPLPNSQDVMHISEMGEEKAANYACNSVTTASKNSAKNGMKEKLDFCKECDRLKTFEKWAVSFVDKRDLAAAGFYYTGQCDAVKCPFCSVGLANWVPGDQPLEEHRKQSPNCVFVQGVTACSRMADDERPPTGEDTCGPFDIGRSVYAERQSLPNEPLINAPSNEPKYPSYKSYEARLKTFENWSYSYKVAPDMLSLAGFVCTKIQDITFCFHCGLKIHQWDENDDPWVEHAHWSPECNFVINKKGQRFIEEARATKHESLVHTQEVLRGAIESFRQMIPESVNEDRVNEKNTIEMSSDNHSSKDREEKTDCQLKDTVETGKELSSCLICLNKKRQTVLLPCYHVVGCENCVSKLKNCCVCREPIIYWRKIYFS